MFTNVTCTYRKYSWIQHVATMWIFMIPQAEVLKRQLRLITLTYFDSAYGMLPACQYPDAGRTMGKVDMVSSPHGTFTLVGDIDLQTGIYRMVCQITG